MRAIRLFRLAKAAHDVSGEARIPKGQKGGGEWTKAGASTVEVDAFTGRLPELEARIEKLNRVCRKLNIPEVVLKKVGEPFIKWFNIVGPDGRTTPRGAEYQHVTVTGDPPKIDGWEFVGVIQHNDKVNTYRAAPGQSIPEKYRRTGTVCDHCKTKRQRAETFIVRDEKGRTKQVGRSCLKDFLGHADPAALANAATWFFDLVDIDEYGKEPSFEAFPRAEWRFKPDEYLPFVACAIRQQGWVPRSAAGFGKTATADDAMYCGLTPSKGLKEADKLKPTPKDVALAKKALAWIKKVPAAWRTGNDYRQNLWAAFQNDGLVRRDMGIAASVVNAYLRHIEDEEYAAKQAALREKKGGGVHVGKVGDRIDFVGTVKSERHLEGAYGVTTLYSIDGEDGNVYKWFASGEGHMEVGEKYKLKGTVKGHDEYKGVKQTVMTRCKVGDLMKSLLMFYARGGRLS